MPIEPNCNQQTSCKHGSPCCLTSHSIHNSTTDALKQPRNVTKIIAIILIASALASTEIALFYLCSVNISWKKVWTSEFDLHRIVYSVSLAATTFILVKQVIHFKKNERFIDESRSCSTTADEYKNTPRSYQLKRWDLVDFIYSCVVTGTYLVSALYMIAEIPNVYEHHVEVGIKVSEFLIDLILALIFTQSSVAAYLQYNSDPMHCDDTKYDRILDQHNSFIPSSDDEFDEERITLFQTVNGNRYTRLPT